LARGRTSQNSARHHKLIALRVCSPSQDALPSSRVTSDQAEVPKGQDICPLSRGVMLPFGYAHGAAPQAQSLSNPLQAGLRFLRPPLPASPLAYLTACLPNGRPTGLPYSVPVPARVRACPACLVPGRCTWAAGTLARWHRPGRAGERSEGVLAAACPGQQAGERQVVSFRWESTRATQAASCRTTAG
jgi:hypothetical protein